MRSDSTHPPRPTNPGLVRDPHLRVVVMGNARPYIAHEQGREEIGTVNTEPNEEDLRRALVPPEDPPPEPAYSDDLTAADVTPLQDFLRARLTELKERQPMGSEEHFAAHALTNTMLSSAMRLTEEINVWQLAVADGRSEEPGPVQFLRHSLGRDFNMLVWVARRWREHPDFAPHWRPRHYPSPAHRAALVAGGDHVPEARTG